MVWTNAHNRTVFLMDAYVPPWHVILVDRSDFPQIAEACQKGPRDSTQMLSVSSKQKLKTR